MGGAIAVVAAARLHPAAVVDLSGERDTTGLTAGIHADGHGWELLSGTTREWAPLAATVAAFIRRHACRRSRPGQ
jgi:hypothetical protein